jgi:hypothetical protein
MTKPAQGDASARRNRGEGRKENDVEKLESALILLAVLSLLPLLQARVPGRYYFWLAAVLASMVWVLVRRVHRIRSAAEEAKRKRDEAEKSGLPPFLR